MKIPRSPAVRLAISIFIAALLTIPLLMVYALVYDREQQANQAQETIARGWGDEQKLSGPIMAIPWVTTESQQVEVDGSTETRKVETRRTVWLSPEKNSSEINIKPQKRHISIYETVVYQADIAGIARFALPEDLHRYGIKPEELRLDQAEIHFGVRDASGLQAGASLMVDGTETAMRPGRGTTASKGAGFFAFIDWSEKAGAALDVTYKYGLKGHGKLQLWPDGGNTHWSVKSPWPHPGFEGEFLPASHKISDKGFEASYDISNIALGRTLVNIDNPESEEKLADISLVEPVDLYSQVDRSVKYGFLFIGFTFLAFLMFDVIGGARVAAAEYLLSGAGLVLFFIMLLAFAEVVGFALAYIIASVAIIGLLGGYSAAILGSRKRGLIIAAILTGLYALLYILLSLESWSLMLGSVLLFITLACVMYMTRKLDWSSVQMEEEQAE